MKANQPKTNFKIRSVSAQHPDALKLLEAAALEVRRIYADLLPENAPMPQNPPDVPGSAYLIAYQKHEPAGCIALRPFEANTGEVKRVFVQQNFRRQGLAMLLLETIEDTALALGYRQLVLETGVRQQGAIALYQACGWQPIPAYGEHRFDPTSMCFSKILTPSSI